jgi:hypothetical protein
MHFLLFGSVWFWLVIGIAVILMMTATEKGSGLGATVTFLVSVAILYFFGNQSSLGAIFAYGIDHPWSAISVVVAYFILGTCWAIMKWYFFLIDARDKAKEENHSFLHVPNVTEHKGKIMLWMFYWPFSSVWTLIDHPVKKIFQFIYNRIKDRMQKMANKIFAPLTTEREQLEKIKQEELESRRRSRSYQ